MQIEAVLIAFRTGRARRLSAESLAGVIVNGDSEVDVARSRGWGKGLGAVWLVSPISSRNQSLIR
jgi:hypothetical protein